MSSISIRKGEYVLHAQHGVGKIESVDDCSFGGCEPASYVQLYFERDALRMTVLENDLPEMVRGLISADEARKLLGQVTEWDGKPRSQWKARANAHQAAIESGDPFQYVKVLKGLALLESGGALRSSDRAHFSTSLSLLTEELACALKKSHQQVRKLLTQAIGTTV